eukprot:1670939-Rhodomonas_salina.6
MAPQETRGTVTTTPFALYQTAESMVPAPHMTLADYPQSLYQSFAASRYGADSGAGVYGDPSMPSNDGALGPRLLTHREPLLSFAPNPTFPAQISRDIDHTALESQLVYAQDPYGPRLWITQPADMGDEPLPEQVLELPDLYPPADLYGSMVFAPQDNYASQSMMPVAPTVAPGYATDMAPTVAPMYASQPMAPTVAPMYASQPNMMVPPTVAPMYASFQPAPNAYASQPALYASQPYDGTMLAPTVAPMYGTQPNSGYTNPLNQYPDFQDEGLPLPTPQRSELSDLGYPHLDMTMPQPRYVPPWERGVDPNVI